MKKVNIIFLLFLLLTGCTSSGVSWDALKKQGNTNNYCSSRYTDVGQVKSCEVELAALQKAQRECKKDTYPDYCVLMAKYSWKNFKSEMLTSEPTLEHAELYPVICGHKERAIKLCSEIGK